MNTMHFAAFSLLFLSSITAFAQKPGEFDPPGTDGEGLQLYFQPSDCNRLMKDAGQLADVSEVIQETANQMAYLQELEAFHKRRGTRGYLVSSAEGIKTLESEFGPPITFTTFSRELTVEEHSIVADEVVGVLSNLPPGGAIITSGGTMGDRDQSSSLGGGVGITQTASMNLGFKTLSVTASKAFKYRAAHADYLFFTIGEFSSESRTMYQVSKALIVIGGGGQAYNEALEYLQYNPEGILVLVDAAGVEGSSRKLLNNPRFAELARVHPNIIVAKNGSEAAILLTERLGLKIGEYRSTTLRAASNGINRISPNVDLHMLFPNSRVVGFSGWSNFDRSLPDAIPMAHSIETRIKGALGKIHQALLESQRGLIYATAGNDPEASSSGVKAFESYVHDLGLDKKRGKFVALTASELDPAKLNSKISAFSYVAPTWQTRTFQLPARVDLLITSGGNQTIIDQSVQAAHLQRPQLHILGANTLTDLRIEALKSKNPNLVTLMPEEIESKDPRELRFLLGFSPRYVIQDTSAVTRLGLSAVPKGGQIEVRVQRSQDAPARKVTGAFVEVEGGDLVLSTQKVRRIPLYSIVPGSFRIVEY